jgi:peptidyl-prolyl cis-trans isomerase A (cyclophilin A)
LGSAADHDTVVQELYPDVVPATVDNFLVYVNNGFYIKTLFHRVISGFVIQAGGYTTGLVKKEGQAAPIALESNRGLSNTRGTVAMARTSAPNSATSEFYVNVAEHARCAAGRCVDCDCGADAVKAG